MTFTVDPKPDAGDFAGERLAWDVLHWTGSHHAMMPTAIDLFACPHLKPYAIACLAALGTKGGRQIPLRMPTASTCSNHLNRLGLPGFFANGNTIPLVPRSTNVPIQQMMTFPTNSFSTDVMEIWAKQVGQLPAGLQADLETHLDEVILNALTHSWSPVGCVMAGQAFPLMGKVEVAIVDLGITIRAHLSHNPRYAHVNTDISAIEMALQSSVTGTPDGSLNRFGHANSGFGLYNLARFCYAGGGNLTVLSGDAYVVIDSLGLTRHRLTPRFQGTLVNVCFRTDIQLPQDPIDVTF